MRTDKNGKITYALQVLNGIPFLLFGIVIILLGSHWFTRTMYAEIEVELDNVAHNIITILDVAYPGDYHLEGETAYRLFKGDTDLTNEYSILDRIKKDTGLDSTLFYQDTRILTTIENFSGQRIIGSGAPEIIIQNVLNAGESHFYHNTIINREEYFAYYMPLRNSDGTIIGMIFVGKPSKQVNQAIQRSVYPLAFADILAMMAVAVWVFFYTRSFGSVLKKIQLFLSSVSSGNLNAVLDSSVISRNDELGDIGRSALTMQRSLRTMIEQDTLTGLFNRRSGDRKLQQVIRRYVTQETPFCLAIGDIDFFKKINDTYGHDCGDMILRNISDKLREQMFDCGFAVRWGGEEFLLVFDRTCLEDAHHILEDLLNKIRSMENFYDNQCIKVTMTFGLVSGDMDDIKQLIRRADEKLYEGKEAGRNRVIL